MTSGRARLLEHVSEDEFLDHVFTLAALGGWHGAHTRMSRGVMVGLHSPHRQVPRAAGHQDASGVPDLLLVHPERGVLLLAELKRSDGRVSSHQQLWLEWLSHIRQVQAPVWRPEDEHRIREVLLG